MRIEIPHLAVTDDDVKQIDEIVRDVARWNRNGYAHREVLLFTSDITLVRETKVRVRKDYHKSLGWCWFAGTNRGLESKVCWVKPGQAPVVELETVVHELVHAYSGTTISHEQAFRRFCTIATCAVFDAFPTIGGVPTVVGYQQFAEELCGLYQRYSHSNPYEADRHVQAYKDYKGSAE